MSWIPCVFLGIFLIVFRYIFKTFFDNLIAGYYCADVIYITIIVLGLFLIWYYIDNNKSRGVNSFHQVGKDISDLIKWIFSVNGLFVLLICAVIALVGFVIQHKGSNDNDVQLQLISVTLTITLSALIPTMISRIVTKNQLNDIIEQKLEAELAKYKSSLYNIRKDKGHASRMSAVLLEQMSESNNTPKDEQTCQNNAAWSIGWASDAIIQYVLIRDDYSNAIKNSAACLNIIYRSAHHIILEDSGKIKSDIKLRDLKSLTTMHSLILQSGIADILQEEANQQRQQEDIISGNESNVLLSHEEFPSMIDSIEIIERAFYQKYMSNPKATPIILSNFCSITGMSAEFNKELNTYAERIIKAMKEPRKESE